MGLGQRDQLKITIAERHIKTIGVELGINRLHAAPP
jgi:hypothetical protein